MSQEPQKATFTLPRVAVWMAKASLPETVQDEALDAFQDQFEEMVAERGLVKARVWAIRSSLRMLHDEYRVEITLFAFLLAIVGAVLAV